MIKIFPEKIIAFFIIIAGFFKIISGKIKNSGYVLLIISVILAALSAVLFYNVVYYKNSAETYKIRLENNKEYSRQLEYDIKTLKESKPINTVYTQKVYNVPVPEAHKKSNYDYNSIPTHNSYAPTAITQESKQGNNYHSNINEEIQERRIIEAESKINHLELERDLRTFF